MWLPYYALWRSARLIAAFGLWAIVTLTLASLAAQSRRLGAAEPVCDKTGRLVNVLAADTPFYRASAA